MPDAKAYSGAFEGAYTLFPDNALAVDVSGGDVTFTEAKTVYCGAAGTVAVRPWNGSSDVSFTIPAGGVVPVRVRIVRQTGTSSTGLVAIW